MPPLTFWVQQALEHWVLTAEAAVLKEEAQSEAHISVQQALVRNARLVVVQDS